MISFQSKVLSDHLPLFPPGLIWYSLSVLHRLHLSVLTTPDPTPWASLIASQAMARTSVRTGVACPHVEEDEGTIICHVAIT